MHVYCSQKHQNQPNQRFCTQCGELLPLPEGQVLANRYRIVQPLGQGGFGRTYLAEDISQSHKNCVVKEFAPQVQQPEQLQKAKELFEREAKVLAKLHHPQIPAFHQTLQVQLGPQEYLFLVQDYIAGETLDELLQVGKIFSELEVQTLLQQILPVLTYIHAQNVVHRDISPDNLMWRSSDNLPVLIDFGGVKQLANTKFFWFNQNSFLYTSLGKEGYAPEEQLRNGQVFPCSDLYSLAVTALVLLTGREPKELYNGYQGNWRWEDVIKVSPALEIVLKKMLADNPRDRYQSADEVLKALSVAAKPKVANTYMSRLRTMVAAPKWQPRKSQLKQNNPQHNLQNNPQSATIIFPSWVRPLGLSFAATSAVVLVGAGTWAVVNGVIRAIPSIPSLPSLPTSQGQGEDKPSQTANVDEATRIKQIVQRRQALEVSEVYFNDTVNDIFYRRNPRYLGRSLSQRKEDKPLRDEWQKSAEQLLDGIERANLSRAARRRLGKYSERDGVRWRGLASNGQLGNYTPAKLTTETDKKFAQVFSDVETSNLNDRTLGQIWYAIAGDKVEQLQKRN
jgi:serine/threonine-protein kinase